MSCFKTIRQISVLAVVLSPALTALPAAYAQLTTFGAASSSGDTPVGACTFTNSGSNSNLNVVNGSIPLYFTYRVANGYGSAYTQIPATLKLSGTVNGPATLTGSMVREDFSNATFTIVADTPVDGFTNLLSGNFVNDSNTTIYLSGTRAGGSASFNVATNNLAGVGAYSSDFLDFVNNPQHIYMSEQFSIAFSGVNDQAPGSGSGLTINSNGYVDSFNADFTSTFSSNPAPASKKAGVPEPADLSLLSLGIVLLSSQVRRARKRRSVGVSC